MVGKQCYQYVVASLAGRRLGPPPPPESRKTGRNSEIEGRHVFNRSVAAHAGQLGISVSTPAWDLAFHTVAATHRNRSGLRQGNSSSCCCRNGTCLAPAAQIPAYEWELWRRQSAGPRLGLLARLQDHGAARQRIGCFSNEVFQKLVINFTWWVNRKDLEGKNLFSGGFLGMDNISVFDRSHPLPGGGHLQQADGTAWMAFFCLTMLSMALELASEDAAYEDVASKFFEHFVAITDAMNTLGGSGLWDEEDGFYYDRFHIDGTTVRARIRSMVGLVPLFAVEVLEDAHLKRLPGFRKRMDWFLNHRQDLGESIAYCSSHDGHGHRLLAIPSRPRLERALHYLLNEEEFLSPHGVRSVSRYHQAHPFVWRFEGTEYRVDYEPGESRTGLFGGNSNWRGPIWFPVNYLLIEGAERLSPLHYGDRLTVECPVGSGKRLTLAGVARELSARLTGLFLPDAQGRRPCYGDDHRYADDPHWRELILFHEYFHGDSGLGLGASHQTGWTAARPWLLEEAARRQKAPTAPIET